MALFSESSEAKLVTCDPRLQTLFRRIVEKYDCIILTGHRGEDDQDRAFRTGHSRLQWPDSPHNKVPAMAVDVAPYPLNWNDHDGFLHFSGYVLGVAATLGVDLRWGGDWNRNHNLKDQTFMDLVHFELMENA